MAGPLLTRVPLMMEHICPVDRQRILFLTWRLSASGGIPRHTRDLGSGLDRCRFDVHVCTVRPSMHEDGLADVSPPVTLHPLGYRGGLGPLMHLRLQWRVWRVIRQLRPDVVHLQSGQAVWALLGVVATRARKRVVLEVHDPPSSGLHGRASSMVEKLMARRLAGLILVNSREAELELLETYPLRPSQLVVVALGTDVDRYSTARDARQSWRRTEQLDVESPVVLYVARLSASKNVRLFLDVAERVLSLGVPASFVVVGGGGEAASLAHHPAVVASPDRVRLIGWRPSVRECFEGADLFLSTADTEGFGLAVIEAMAAGLPVVATAVGGVNDTVVDGETGLLCEKGDVVGLADAVARLLGDPVRRAQMGEAARRRARSEYSIEAMVKRFEACYARVGDSDASSH